MRFLEDSAKRQYLLIAVIITIQLLWLLSIWLTGASTNWAKLVMLGIYSLVCGLIVIYATNRKSASPRTLVTRIIGNEKYGVFVIILGVAIVGIVYSYVQRVWPWDEEYSFKAASLIAREGLGSFFRSYAATYWLHNHPPLIPILYGFSLRLFGIHLFVLRIVSLLFVLGTIWLTYYLGRSLEDHKTGILAAILLSTFPLIFRLGTAALLDIQVTFFFILSVILTYKLIHNPNLILALALGLVISAGLLTKYTMVFIIPLIFILYLISRNYIKPAPYFTLALLICGLIFFSWLAFGKRIGVSVPGVAVLEYLNLNKSIQVGDQAKFSQPAPPGMVPFIDIGWYLTSKPGIKALTNNLGTKLTSAIGPYNIPLIMLGFFFILKRRSKFDIILVCWIVTVFVLLVLTLPDHRYFMPIFPTMAIMMALWLKNHTEAIWGVITVTVLYLGAALYLFADWFRVAELF